MTSWGITQKNMVGKPRIISSNIFNGSRVDPQKGLLVLEMLGLDNKTCLLVVTETIPDSKEPLQYKLILDFNRINFDILKPLHDKEYMYFLNTGKQWTPKLDTSTMGLDG